MNIVNSIPQESYSHQLRQSLSRPSGMTVNGPPHKKQTFISKVQRFQSSSTILTPGPGTYEHVLSDKHTLDFKSNKPKDTIIDQKYAWINGSQRLSYIPSKSSINPLGPGQYEDNGSNYGGDRSHSNWAKGQRFNQLTGFQSKLGPGSYDSKFSLKQAVAPVSVFRSKSPRTFIQEMVEKSAKQAKNRVNPEDDQKDEVIKFEETQYLVRRKANNRSPVFMSKAQRSQLISQNTSCMLGPGTYSSEKVVYKPLETRAPKSSIHYTPASLDNGRGTRFSELGPGTYNYDRIIGSQKFGKKEPLGFIPKSQRFQKSPSLKKTEMSPGPGQYMQNRFSLVKEEDLRFKAKGSFTRKPQKNHNFGQAPRATLRNHNNSPFGQYDLRNYDISHKLERQKQQYEKLKMMEVTLPAFNTKNHH